MVTKKMIKKAILYTDKADTLLSVDFSSTSNSLATMQPLPPKQVFIFLFFLPFFVFCQATSLHAETINDTILDYDGEHVEWNIEVTDTLAQSPPYNINNSLRLLNCVKWDGEVGLERACTYAADAPYYGNVYKVNAKFTPSSGLDHTMWTTIKPYPNHDEYDFVANSQNYIPTAGPVTHSASSVFVPMWPEDVNTAYEIVIRYTSDDHLEGSVGFNIHILFWGFDTTAIRNLPWLKGDPGVNPYLKFCGGKTRPDRRGGGPGL